MPPQTIHPSGFDPTKPFSPVHTSGFDPSKPFTPAEPTQEITLSPGDLDPYRVETDVSRLRPVTPQRGMLQPPPARPGAKAADLSTFRLQENTPVSRDLATTGLEAGGMMLGSALFPPSEAVAAPEAAGMLSRLATRMQSVMGRAGVAAQGALAGRATGEATLPTPTGGPPPGITREQAANIGETMVGGELAGEGIWTAVKAVKRIPQNLIDRWAGPPTLLPAEPLKDLPATDIAAEMGPDATAGQVRSSPLLTQLEGWLRSTFGGRRITDQVANSETKLKEMADNLVHPFGNPGTEREAGQSILTPARAQIRSDMTQETTAASRYHDAVINQRQAEEAGARAQQQLAEAQANGQVVKAQSLQAEVDRQLEEAQRWDQTAQGLRRDVYGIAGPARTEEEAGHITERLRAGAEAHAERAVDQAYQHVDQLAEKSGIQVSLQPVVDAAKAYTEATPEMARALSGRAGTLPPVIERTGTEQAEGAPLVQELRARLGGAEGAGGQEALARALQQAGIDPEEVTARTVSFTQARRIRSELSRIAWNARETNPALAYSAGKYKAAIDAEMTRAAGGTDSPVRQAFDAAQALFKGTKETFEEGILADLAGKDARQVVDFLTRKDAPDVASVWKELGPESQQAVRSALIEKTLKDPATGAWRTGRDLERSLGKLSPETRQVIFGEANEPLGQLTKTTRAGEEAVAGAQKTAKAQAKAAGGVPTLQARATAAAGRTQTASERTQAAAEAYQKALRDVHAGAATKDASLDPVSAFQTLITPRTDAVKLGLVRDHVTQMLGPDAWAQVQARWLHNQLGGPPSTLLKRLSTLQPETVRALIPDTALRNRLYQYARVADHLGKYTPGVSKWVFLTHLSTAAGVAGGVYYGTHSGSKAVGAASTEVLSPAIAARILANPQAGAALISGLKAGEQGAMGTSARLASEVVSFLKREGILGQLFGGPPPVTPHPGRGPGPVQGRAPAPPSPPPAISPAPGRAGGS
jgi:hypothetical protein